MKFDSRNRNSRIPLNKLLVSIAFMIATVAVSVLVAVASSAPARGSNTGIVAGSTLDSVTPMDMRISGISTPSLGQASLVVRLSATNNISSNRNYANAIVTLQSLKLNISYHYTSSLGRSESSTLVVTLTPSFTMRTDEQKTFSVAVAPLPSSAVGPVTVHVSGWYAFVLQSTNTDGSQTTAYGKGPLEFGGTVTAP